MIFAVASVQEAFMSNNVGYILGACVIVLAGVVVFLWRKIEALQKRIDDIQDQRLVEARETQSKLFEPLQRVISMSETIRDAILYNKRGE